MRLSLLLLLAFFQPVVKQLNDDFFHLLGGIAAGKILFQRIMAQGTMQKYVHSDTNIKRQGMTTMAEII